jgi:formate C-acetyltransferase
MMSFGYDKYDAFNYVTSACWEPLVAGLSCDQNNLFTLNFVKPLIDLFASSDFDKYTSIDQIVSTYLELLSQYIERILGPLENFLFEESPLMSIVSKECLRKRKDITRGGAKYNNIGLTTVGLGSTINSLMNIQKLVFREKQYTLNELNEIRRSNFSKNEAIQKELRENEICYGSDSTDIIDLSNKIISFTSKEFSKYHTANGGKFKFGLSSPNYIVGAENIEATFDGRKSGDPFSVHISASMGLPLTELLSFAIKMNYHDNRLNGNVVDFIVTPHFLKENKDKFVKLLFASFSKGIYQLQMNVVDSKTLIAAQKSPDQFPNLIVRVWGFSAYFRDLPKSYQNNLIQRAIESEKVS